MPQLTQGLIVAVLIGLLLAVIVGYYLRQGQVNELTEALEHSQRRQQDLEDQHDQRLREATEQLQKDYEAHLAEKMEQYQAQMDAQRGQLEAEYRSRQGLMGNANAPSAAADSTAEQRIRRQYETRLKEVAAKVQQAYEQHLQAKLLEARSQAQQDYDQRLAEAIAHYQDQAQLAQSTSGVALGALVPEPSAAGESSDLAAVEARLQAEYDQRLSERIAEYQDDMAQRLAQLEQDYEARLQLAAAASPAPGAADPSTEELELNLRRELEAALRAEYEQKLAEKIEHYQDELTQRTQELEQSYEDRLQIMQASPPPEAPPGGTAEDLDLDQAIAAANEIARVAGANTGFSTGLEFAQPQAPDPADPGDQGLAALLNADLANEPDDFNLDSEFDSEFDIESIDLDALLNAAPPDAASDDLLDSLDDISDLS